MAEGATPAAVRLASRNGGSGPSPGLVSSALASLMPFLNSLRLEPKD